MNGLGQILPLCLSPDLLVPPLKWSSERPFT